jgi:DNA transformation protein
MMIKRHSSEFVDFVLEQMAFVQGLQVRKMFGGYGLYQDDHIFAIIVKDTLYLKSDAIVQRDFEEKCLQPFYYVAQGKSVTLRYFEAPSEVFEAPDSMRNWVEKALGASIRQRWPQTFKQQFPQLK